jgi:hypothetical protein
VAAEIGAVQGNVVGLEVLEREAGVAIDELVVELPDEQGAVDTVCRGIRNVPGAGVEEVTELGTGAPDREVTVLAAAAGILQAATAAAALHALSTQLIALFDLTWLALADDELAGFTEVHGDAPTVQWVAAFAEGSRSGADRPTTPRARACSSNPFPRRGSPSAAGAPRRSGAASARRSRCWSWWRRSSSTRWTGGSPSSPRPPEGRPPAAPQLSRSTGRGTDAPGTTA